MISGQYNLALFVQLFWLVVSAFLAAQFTLWPIALLLRGQYILPEGTKGRTCLMEEPQGSHFSPDGHKQILINNAFPMLIIVWITWQMFSTKRFMSGLCPRGRMACVGKYRRNVLTLQGTYFILIANCFCRITGFVMAHYASQLSPFAQFWIWNTTAALWGEGAYLVLPWLLVAPVSDRSSAPLSNFYVTKPVLQPRPQNCMASNTKSHLILVKEFQTLPSLRRLPPIRTPIVINIEECE